MGILSSICKRNGIILYPMKENITKRFGIFRTPGVGCAMSVNGKPVIMYDGEAGEWEQRFIIAHELGHILFGHLRSPEAENNELEANTFAAVITALTLFKEMECIK